MRNHSPIIIEEFNGLYKRGSSDSTPQDHFTDCNNIQFTESGFKVRNGIEPYQNYGNILRIKIWNQSLLILDTSGNIYHTDRASPHTPILTLPGMIDFGFVKLGSHGYISPRGIADDFIYVYIYGDSNPARKVAGDAPTTAPTLNNTAGGK